MAGDRLPRAVIQFDKLTDTQLANYGTAIATGLASTEGALLYPTPPATDVQINSAVASFVAAIAAAEDGGVQETNFKNVLKKNLQDMIRVDAQYVTQIAQTSSNYDDIRLRISYAGYVASKVPEPLSSLPQPEIQFAQSTAIGMLEVQLKAQKGATAYIAYYKKTTDTHYKTFISTSSRFKITGLESNTMYNVYYVYKGTTKTIVTETDVIDYVIL